MTRAYTPTVLFQLHNETSIFSKSRISDISAVSKSSLAKGREKQL